MRRVLAALLLATVALTGMVVGWAIDEQPLPDTFVFWGTTNIVASPLIVTEYELEREGTEVTGVTVKIFNTDVSAGHLGDVEVDVISKGVPYLGEATVPFTPASGTTVVIVTLGTPAPLDELTNVYFYLKDD